MIVVVSMRKWPENFLFVRTLAFSVIVFISISPIIFIGHVEGSVLFSVKIDFLGWFVLQVNKGTR